MGGTATGDHGVGIGKRKFMEVEQMLFLSNQSRYQMIL